MCRDYASFSLRWWYPSEIFVNFPSSIETSISVGWKIEHFHLLQSVSKDSIFFFYYRRFPRIARNWLFEHGWLQKKDASRRLMIWDAAPLNSYPWQPTRHREYGEVTTAIWTNSPDRCCDMGFQFRPKKFSLSLVFIPLFVWNSFTALPLSETPAHRC